MNTIMKRTGNGGNMSHVVFPGLVDSILPNTLGRFFDDSFWGFNGIESYNPAPVNIRETENGFQLELPAPGVRKEDFKIDVKGGVLTVSLDHREESGSAGNEWKRREYKTQSFTRSFSLDKSIDIEGIEASYRDGMLYVALPKKGDAQSPSRTVEIQ